MHIICRVWADFLALASEAIKWLLIQDHLRDTQGKHDGMLDMAPLCGASSVKGFRGRLGKEAQPTLCLRPTALE